MFPYLETTGPGSTFAHSSSILVQVLRLQRRESVFPLGQQDLSFVSFRNVCPELLERMGL